MILPPCRDGHYDYDDTPRALRCYVVTLPLRVIITLIDTPAIKAIRQMAADITSLRRYAIIDAIKTLHIGRYYTQLLLARALLLLRYILRCYYFITVATLRC